MNTDLTASGNSEGSVCQKKKLIITPFDHNSFIKLQEPIGSQTPSLTSTSNNTVLYNESYSSYKGFPSKFRGKIIDHRKYLEELQEMTGIKTPLIETKNKPQVSPKKRRPTYITRLPSHKEALHSVDNKRELIFNFNQDLSTTTKSIQLSPQSKTPYILNSPIKAAKTGRKFLFDLYNKLLVVEKEKIDAVHTLGVTHKRFASVRRDIGFNYKNTKNNKANIRIIRINKSFRYQSNERNSSKHVNHLNKLLHRQYEDIDEILDNFKVKKAVKSCDDY